MQKEEEKTRELIFKTLTTHADFCSNPIYDFNYFDITWEFSNIHNHEFHEFFLVLSGEGIHVVNNQQIPLVPNTLVFLKPQDTHTFLVKKGICMRILNLAFCRETAEPALKWFGMNQTVSLPETVPGHYLLASEQSWEIVSYYHQILVREQTGTMDPGLLSLFFVSLFEKTVFSENAGGNGEEGVPAWLREAVSGLQTRENHEAGIQYLLKKTGKTQSYLCRSFRKYLNSSPSQYINTVRIKNACNLLKYTDRTVTDICYDCGFDSVSHFNHLFKKIHSCSPSQFRKKADRNFLKMK